jgi:hypothetical protein
MSIPKTGKPITEPIQVVFTLSIDGSQPSNVERTLQLENIPGAWRIHGNPGETPGVGGDRFEAVMNFLGRNCSRELNDTQTCKVFFETLLRRAQPDQIKKAAEALVRELHLG